MSEERVNVNVDIDFNEALKRIAQTPKHKIINNDLGEQLKVKGKEKKGNDTHKLK